MKMKTIIFLLIVLLFTSFVVMKEIVENDVYGIFLGREKNRNISVKLQLNNDSTFILNYGRSFCNGKWYLYKNKIYLNCNEPEIYEAISSHFMPKSEFVVLILKKNKLKILQNHNNNNLGYQNIILKRQVAVKFLDAKYNNLLNTNSFSTFCSTLSLGLSMNFKFSIIYEHPIYDTSRLGVRSGTKYLVGQINQGPLGGSFIAYPSDYDGLTGRTIGLKQYELTDHLGNVRVIFGDRLAFTHVTNTVMPEILAVNNYYPFGMIIRSLSWQSDSYRWGFGGHEKDDEVKGTGNHLSFGGYGYDPRLGRRPRPDPVDQIGISNYAVFRNNPMLFVDPTGMIADGYTVDDRGYIEKISDEGGIKYDVLYKKETYSEAIRKDYDISGKKSGLRLNNTKVLPELLKTQKVTEAVAHDTETGEIEIETFDLSKYTTEAKISSEIKREMNRLFYFLANNSNKAEWQLYKSYKEEYGISTLHSLQDSPGTVHLGLKSNDIKMMIHSHPRPKTIEGAKSGLYFDIEAAKHIEKYFVYIPKLGIIFQISNTGELGKMQAP